jgi:hypothetical protein
MENGLRRVVPFAAAALLLALALVAALLAADVRTWQRTMRSDDALLVGAPRSVHWQPSTHLGSASERLLGVDDDVRVRKALALFLQTVNRTARFGDVQETTLARGQAEQALAAIGRTMDPVRASQAETLLGVLVFTDVGPSADPFADTTSIDPEQAQASLADFTDAVRTNPDNALAKYDLELALRALLTQGIRGSGQQTGAGSQGQRGAGGGLPGGGY